MTWDFVYQIRRFELVKSGSIIIRILQRWQMILHMKFKGTNWTFLFPKILKQIFCGRLSRRSLPWLESILSSEQFLFPNKYQSQTQISKQRLHGLLLMALLIVRDRQWKVWFPVLNFSRSSKKSWRSTDKKPSKNSKLAATQNAALVSRVNYAVKLNDLYLIFLNKIQI